MTNHIVCLLIGLILAISSTNAFAKPSNLTLAKNGKTKYVIVIGNDATDVEKTAAKELEYYLGKVTSAKFNIYDESNAPKKSPQILIGQCQCVTELVPNTNWSALGKDGIVIKTVGNTLILAGSRPRGTLYAVYTFLEDIVGCRWWTSSEDFIPSKLSLSIPSLNTTYKPPFYYRETYYADVMNNPQFAAKLKLNGHFENISPEYGGHYSIIGWCHTFNQFLPPDKYFSEHPDWYSEIGGKRTSTNAQLCLTNDEMRQEMTRIALEKISQNPNAGMISISQNDCGGRCGCAKCKALEEKEGSPSGPLLHFVNLVAADIEKQYPNVVVETLAYQYTRKPPLHVKPRHNVLIRLCTIECSFVHPLENPINKAFQDDILAWQVITPNLYVWDYVTNFVNFITPHPNLRVLGPNLKYFAKNNVIGVFEQGDGFTAIGDFIRMRAWVISHLLWDPSRDASKLQKEFIIAYYGSAAPYIAKYLDVVCNAGERSKRLLGCMDQDPTYMRLGDMNKATMLFNKAEEAVAGDAVLTERVKRDRITLDHLWVMRGNFLKAQAEMLNKPYAGPKNIVEAGERFLCLVKEYKTSRFNETQTYDGYESSLRTLIKSPGLTRDKCKLFSDTEHIEIQDSMFRPGNPDWSLKVDDPLASDGSAFLMPGTHNKWAAQYLVTQELADMFPGKTHCYVVVRCEAEKKSGTAFTYGIYDFSNAKHIELKDTQIEACDGAYHVYDLGVHNLKSTYRFWVAPPGKDLGVKEVYVDCVVLAPTK